jgi:hypothetical protein
MNLLRWLKRFLQTKAAMRSGGRHPNRRKTRLELDPLEERLVLSWGAVPPASITLPTAPEVLTLNAPRKPL